MAAAAPAKVDPVVVRDAKDARPGGLDLTRVQLGRSSDGRLRATLTLAAAWKASDLPAGSGPPGSLCLRLWGRDGAGARAPDHLVCVTADRDGEELRGSVMEERPGDLPRRTGAAVVSRSSARTIAVRFSQSAVGRPARIRFAGEATKPGCARVSCVDTAPDAPKTATLRLREG